MYTYLDFLPNASYNITLRTVSSKSKEVHKDFHPHYELYFCPLDIPQSTIINGVPVVLNQPSVIISAPFSVHGMSKYNGAGEYFPRYAVYLSDEFLESIMDMLPEGVFNNTAGCVYLLDSDTRDFMQTIFNKMLECKEHNKEFTAYLIAAINTLYRTVSGDSRIVIGASKHHYIIDVLRYINDNKSRAPDGDEIAAAFHVSRAKLDRDFHEFVGTTLHKTVVRFRVGYAVALLTKTDMPVRDVARACGFDNEYYFYAFFKNAVGKTPLAVRRAGHAY